MRGYFSLTFYIYYSGIFSFLQISFCSFRFRNGGFYFVFSLTFYIYYSEILFDFQILFCFCLTMRRRNLTFKVKFLLKIFLIFLFFHSFFKKIWLFLLNFWPRPAENKRKRSFSEAEIKRSSFAARENTIAAPLQLPKRSFFVAPAIWQGTRHDDRVCCANANICSYTVYCIQYTVYCILYTRLKILNCQKIQIIQTTPVYTSPRKLIIGIVKDWKIYYI